MNKLKVNNKNKSANKSNLVKVGLLTISLLFTLNVFANDDWDDIMLPGGGGNPNDAPIDSPYFWVLLFLIGGYIAYKKLQPKTT